MMGLSRGLALVLVLCGVAGAQPKEPTAAQKQKIQDLAKRAISKSQNNDHEGAVKDLLEAYAIAPSAAVVLLSNVGYEYKQMKRPVDALKYFCLYLEKDPTGSAASYVTAEAKTIHTELKLSGEVCAKKPEVENGAGTGTGTGTGTGDPNDAGNGTVTPNHPDDTATGNGQVTGTVGLTKTSTPSSPGKTMRWAGLGIGGAGAVVLGAGIVFGIQAKDKADQITKGPPIDPNTGMQVSWGPHPELGWDGIVKLQDDGHRAQNLQIALTITGAAMVIGGTALYFMGSKKKHSEVTVTPTAGPDSLGVHLGGSF